MSHFTVLVIGDNYEQQLAPYHEFECTGEDNEFVQDIDITEETRQEYQESKQHMVRSPDGSIESPFTKEGEYKAKFLREPTPEEAAEGGMLGIGRRGDLHYVSRDFKDGRGYRAKIYEVPEGCTEIDVPTSEVMSFTDYATRYERRPVVKNGDPIPRRDRYKYGYVILNSANEVVKIVRRTNPNARWDWYQVGGRWSGYFKMKPTAVGAVHGTPSLLDRDFVAKPDEADIIRKGDVDFEAMRQESGDNAAKRYDKLHAIIDGRQYLSWESLLVKYPDDIARAREEYHGQPIIRAIRESEDEDIRWAAFDGLDDLMVPRDQFIQQARDNAISTFAVVKDGQWYERGKMGFWAMVRDEKDRDEWTRQFNELIDGLPDDTILTVVDCHI